MVVLSAWYDHMGGTRGSSVVSSAYDVLEMSEVHGVRGAGAS